MAFWNKRLTRPCENPQAVIFHSLHKCASMFMYQVFFRLSRAKRLPYYSPNHIEPTDHLVTPDIDHNFCFGPVRDFRLDNPELNSSVSTKRIFQIRDPRDILCSEYYSFGWTHIERDFTERAKQTREQIRNQTIDEYLLDEEGGAFRLCRRLKPLLLNLSAPDVTLVTYEEMVSNFPSWLRKVVEPFDFNPIYKSFLMKKLCIKYKNEFRPDPSNPHKRNVKPGEHRRKLKPETIAELNRQLAPYLEATGYPLRASEA